MQYRRSTNITTKTLLKLGEVGGRPPSKFKRRGWTRATHDVVHIITWRGDRAGIYGFRVASGHYQRYQKVVIDHGGLAAYSCCQFLSIYWLLLELVPSYTELIIMHYIQL